MTAQNQPPLRTRIEDLPGTPQSGPIQGDDPRRFPPARADRGWPSRIGITANSMDYADDFAGDNTGTAADDEDEC
ncbi:hypothetical protein [Actinorugispora endophytica]|uniref:hypothetical protein n=1 Tax=Actinorugispora endophytica TaxID=1605990 RepID=UPI00105D01A5|nr:hypothetical protein [Actinorugispora endophytica]